MTIASEIQRIQTNIANAYDALEAKGATMPVTENTDNLVTTINTVSGGGDEITATNNTGTDILSGDKICVERNPIYSTNFDIIGSPSINYTAGVVTDFSTVNGLLHSDIYSGTSTSWEIVVKFTTGTDISSNQAFFAQNNIDNHGIIGFLYNNKFLVYASSNNTSWDVANGDQIVTASANTTYWFKYSWNGSTFSVAYSTDGETYTTAQTYSTQPTFIENNVYIGYRGCETSNYWRGSIDLIETYIKVNGQIWWKPEWVETSYYYTIENLTSPLLYKFTGTPKGSVRVSNFVASNFTQNSYMEYTQTIDFSIPWEFNTIVFRNTDDYSSGNNAFVYSAVDSTSSSTTDGGFSLFGAYYWRFVGSFGDIGNSSITLNTNTTYYIKCGWTGTQYYLKVSTDGEHYTTIGTIDSTTPVEQTNNKINIGSSNWVSTFYWKGYIFLQDTFIIQNGKKVFSACEDNDVLTGYTKEVITNGSTGEVLTLVEPKYYAYKDLLNRYVYCQNIITSTQYYYNLNARSDNTKASSISELTVPSRAKPKSVSNTGAVTFNIMPYYRSEQDDLY